MSTSLPISSSAVSIASSQIDISTMNPDDAMLIVQADRVKLCESELNAQIKTIQAKNDQMRKLNELQATLAETKAMFNQTGNDAWLRDQTAFQQYGNERGNKFVAFENAWIAAGLDPSFVGGTKTDPSAEGAFAKGNVQYKTFEAMSTALKGSIDSLSSSTQMDMVRMQSLNNKRSEAFETMTNMMKKAQDNKSSIVGNMR